MMSLTLMDIQHLPGLSALTWHNVIDKQEFDINKYNKAVIEKQLHLDITRPDGHITTQPCQSLLA